MFDLGDLANKLYSMSNDLHEGLADGVQKNGRRVMNNAKKRLGSYQNGWERLKDATVRRKLSKNERAAKYRIKKYGGLHATGTDADAPLVDEGLYRASITMQMDRRRIRAEIGSPLVQAATHEFGDESRGIPERAHFRPALQEESKHLEDDLRDGVTRRLLR